MVVIVGSGSTQQLIATCQQYGLNLVPTAGQMNVFALDKTNMPILVKRILSLTQEFSFIPTFDPTEGTLLDALERNNYFILNGNYLSLTDEMPASADVITDLIDSLSGCLVKEPVKCSHHHVLERDRVQTLLQHATDWENTLCPVGDQAHEIGELVVDQGLLTARNVFAESQLIISDLQDTLEETKVAANQLQIEVKEHQFNRAVTQVRSFRKHVKMERETTLALGASKKALDQAVQSARQLQEDLSKAKLEKHETILALDASKKALDQSVQSARQLQEDLSKAKLEKHETILALDASKKALDQAVQSAQQLQEDLAKAKLEKHETILALKAAKQALDEALQSAKQFQEDLENIKIEKHETALALNDAKQALGQAVQSARQLQKDLENIKIEKSVAHIKAAKKIHRLAKDKAVIAEDFKKATRELRQTEQERDIANQAKAVALQEKNAVERALEQEKKDKETAEVKALLAEQMAIDLAPKKGDHLYVAAKGGSVATQTVRAAVSNPAVQKIAQKSLEKVAAIVAKYLPLEITLITKGGEEAGKAFAKGLPFVGLAIAVIETGYHLQQKNRLRAAVSAASGGVSFVPIVGPTVSVAISAAFVASELYLKRISLNSIEDAYKRLGFKPDRNGFYNITKQLVDERYREMTLTIHEDKLHGVDDLQKRDARSQLEKITAAKELIYRHHNFE